MVAQSAAAEAYQSPASAAASSSQFNDQTQSGDAASADVAVAAAAETTTAVPTVPQTNAAGADPATTSKGTGTNDQPAVEKSAAAPDQSSLGVTSTAGSNPRTEPLATADHSATNTTTDPLQRSQELVDRVTNILRTSFDTGGEMRVRLEPPALGRVQVDVSSGSSGVTARLEVQTASARQTLLNNISLLHTAITQTGASVSRIDVVLAPQPKDDSASDRQPSSDGQQQASTQGDSQGGSQNQPNGQKQNPSSSIDQLDIEV
jgi:flagellar hook-length control protein FliK